LNVLLVEPNYKNKYPPMGLMKISTYHKNRGDNVSFYKGVSSKEDFAKGAFDRVYITSMFTFHYDITLKTIKSYEEMIDPSRIFVGGIMATLMKNRLATVVDENVTILTGLLTDSTSVGFDDHVNIDVLPLDYSILDETSFKYGAGDNYFAYVSRGCTNKCRFCAVPILEPKFCMTNHIVNQIETIKKNFGEKQNLLLLDNNILSFSALELGTIVDDIYSLGFDKTTKFYPELPFATYTRKLRQAECGTPAYKNILSELLIYLQDKMSLKKSKNYDEKYKQIMASLEVQDDKVSFIMQNYDVLHEILGYYHKPTGRKRIVDFNQGIDARQLTEEKMSILAKLPIEPFRLAFDGLEYEDVYVKAVRLATKYGVKHFSNYILYNFDDEPNDLWTRLKINIDLGRENDIRVFSFPMRYAPIDQIDRTSIGTHWNKHYLSNIYAILNVTKGIVAQGEAFFCKAFGKDLDEFHEILSMPRDFVMYRSHFENNGQAEKWKKSFCKLSPFEKHELIDVLCEKSDPKCQKVSEILSFYKIKYRA